MAGKMRELQDEMDQQFVESPTLGQYFENQAKGQGAFNKLGGFDYERTQEEEEFNRILEE